MHPLDEALVLTAHEPGLWSVETSEIYWNMIGPFGGWLFAAGLRAVLAEPAASGEPVEAHARFMAAPKAGRVWIRVRCQSQGRSVGFWRAELFQRNDTGEKLCTEVSVLLAQARPTADLAPVQMPAVPAPESLADAPMRNASVRWIDRYRFRYLSGAPFGLMPGDPDVARLRSVAWTGEAQPRPLDWAGITAFCDLPVPRTFLVQQAPSPISTVSMALYFHATGEEIAASGSEWLLMEVDANAARRGFFDHHVRLWRRDGRLLATSTQLAWFS